LQNLNRRRNERRKIKTGGIMTREYTITVTAPCECTDAEMEEWVEFCLGYTAQISTENPLWEFDLEVDDIS
jgi:hypothetical protein